MNAATIHVVHNEAASRFEATVDGLLCICDYHRTAPGVAAFTHTVVPQALAGRGIAAELVKTALAWAAAQGLRVQPQCSYVDAYMRKHPEVDKLRA